LNGAAMDFLPLVDIGLPRCVGSSKVRIRE
jgi:hypothetical protein